MVRPFCINPAASLEPTAQWHAISAEWISVQIRVNFTKSLLPLNTHSMPLLDPIIITEIVVVGIHFAPMVRRAACFIGLILLCCVFGLAKYSAAGTCAIKSFFVRAEMQLKVYIKGIILKWIDE